VLPAMDPTALESLAQTRSSWRPAVVSSGLPRAGLTKGVPLKVVVLRVHRATRLDQSEQLPVASRHVFFCRSPWAIGVLRARVHGCPEDKWTCAYAARGGHVEVLQWAREYNCPWDAVTCAFAAWGGHLDVLMLAQEHHCPWDTQRAPSAHLHVNLRFASWCSRYQARDDSGDAPHRLKFVLNLRFPPSRARMNITAGACLTYEHTHRTSSSWS